MTSNQPEQEISSFFLLNLTVISTLVSLSYPSVEYWLHHVPASPLHPRRLVSSPRRVDQSFFSLLPLSFLFFFFSLVLSFITCPIAVMGNPPATIIIAR